MDRWVELRKEGKLFGKFCPAKNVIELSSKGRIVQFDLAAYKLPLGDRQERQSVVSLNKQCCDELAVRR